MKWLITGGAGFVGSALIRELILNQRVEVRALIRNSHQKNFRRLDRVLKHHRLEIVYGDLTQDIGGICEGVDVVANLAALTFVDRAILNPEPFIRNNCIGAFNLLEDSRRYKVGTFYQMSTDEVLGPILEGAHDESAPSNPSNIYAASKQAAESLCIAYARTHGIKTVIGRGENIFGIFQHRQKMLPTFVRSLIENEPIPVYGDGLHTRCWLHVEDAVSAILHLVTLDCEPGSIFHIGSEVERTNMDMARQVCGLFNLAEPYPIRLVDDRDVRPGHDRRYRICTAKSRATGWKPRMDLETGLDETVAWYRAHPDWLK